MEKNFIFAVKVGRNPGIYDSREEMLKEVVKFPGAIVGKFLDFKKAENYLNSPLFLSKRQLKREKYEKTRENIKPNKDLNLKLNNDIICFVDCEANKGMAISIGAVIIDNKTNDILDTFYSTIRPKDFICLEPVIQKITGLTNEEIIKSESFNKVYPKFETFINKYNVKDIFSWGKSDRQFLLKHGKKTPLIKNITNIQTIISSATSDVIYKKEWSLNDIKKIFNLNTIVKHNALSDALDLSDVYINWKHKNINIDVVYEYKNILESKKQKLERVS